VAAHQASADSSVMISPAALSFFPLRLRCRESRPCKSDRHNAQLDELERGVTRKLVAIPRDTRVSSNSSINQLKDDAAELV